MKKRRILYCAIIILILIVLDQGTKLIVDNYFDVPENVMQISDTIHIHPKLNDIDMQKMLPLADKFSLNMRFLMLIKAALFTIIMVAGFFLCYGVQRFFFWDCQKKSYLGLNIAILCLAAAGIICSVYIDELCFGGSFDWICCTWVGVQPFHNDHYHAVSYHFTFDMKDIYLWIGMILFVVRVVLFLITYLQSTQEEQKGYDRKLKHPLQNIRNMKVAAMNGRLKKEETEEQL